MLWFRVMKVNLLYNYYYDFNKAIVTIGGIQTYIHDLVGIFLKEGYSVFVFQTGNSVETTVVAGYTIKSIKTSSPRDYQTFVDEVAKLTDVENDLYIFGTDAIIPRRNPFKHSIGIQHGINWDMPRAKSRNSIVMQLLKARRNYGIMRKVNNVAMLVCVDYNFVNWMRAQSDKVVTKMTVIPNYTQIAPHFEKPKDRINIIFARRFWWYRGTRVFTYAIKRILEEYDDVFVTIAGSGPDEEWMHSELDSCKKVTFTSYSSSESMAMHADKHIAVVPTVGSEGTSLSLLEAMSAQCAVVASDVGGMTNILLDGYNGYLVPAGNVDRLYDAIKNLINNPDIRSRIALNGYETTKCSFSYQKWEKSWMTALEEFIDSYK